MIINWLNFKIDNHIIFLFSISVYLDMIVGGFFPNMHTFVIKVQLFDF